MVGTNTMSFPTILNVENCHGLKKYQIVGNQSLQSTTRFKQAEQASFVLGYMGLLVCFEVHPPQLLLEYALNRFTFNKVPI